MFSYKNIFFKIQPTILVIFFITISVFSAALLFQKYLNSKKIALKATSETFNQYSQKIKERINNFEKRNKYILIPLSKIDKIENLPKKNESFKNFKTVVELMKTNTELYGFHIGDKKGNTYIFINLNIHNKLTSKYQKNNARWLEERIYYKDLENEKIQYYYDKDLKLIKTKKIKTTYDARTRPWYNLAISNNKINKTSPYSFANLSTQGITYSKQINNSRAVIALSYTISTISQNLKDSTLNTKTRAFIFNENRQLTANLNKIENEVFIEKKVSLTKKEKQYIKTLRTITITNEVDWPPYDYAISGEPRGYSIDMIKLLIKKLDLNVKFINGYTWNELMHLYERRKIDIIHSVISKDYKKDDDFISNEEYLDVSPKLITKKDSKYTTLKALEDNYKTIAVAKGFSYAYNYISKNYPNLKIIFKKNSIDSLESLSNDIVQGTLMIDKTYEHISKSYHINNLKMNKIDKNGMQDDIFTGLNYISKNKKLISLLDKAYKDITKKEQEYINKRWFSFKNTDFYLNHSNTIPSLKILDFAKKNTENIHIMNLYNEPYFLFASKLNTLSNNQYIAMLVKEEDVMKPYMEAIYKSFFVSVLLFIFLSPLIWYISSLIAKPILKLKDESEKIKNREYKKVKLLKTPIKEIYSLSNSLVDMSKKLDKHEKEQDDLLNSFIQLIAEAIDEKSIYTGGHCNRVPILTLMLANEAVNSNKEPFKDFNLKTKDEKRELEIAAWLHDCGKVATPEYVVDKAVKLETIYNRIHEIRTRFEVLYRDLYIKALEDKIAKKDEYKINEELKKAQEELFEEFEFIAKANIGGEFMSNEDIKKIEKISNRVWTRYFDDSIGLSKEEQERYKNINKAPFKEKLLNDKNRDIIPRQIDKTQEHKELGFNIQVPKHLYNKGEIYNLCIKKGTLTNEERYKINAHIMLTIKMLKKLPLPKELSNIPEYAGGHHETLIGTGYPKGLTKEEMSIPARIMAIADIFEALTAADRPYKDAKTLSESLKIMKFMVKDKHIDEDLFRLFLEKEVYLHYAKKYLKAEQIDKIDIKDYL